MCTRSGTERANIIVRQGRFYERLVKLLLACELDALCFGACENCFLNIYQHLATFLRGKNLRQLLFTGTLINIFLRRQDNVLGLCVWRELVSRLSSV